MPLLRGRLINVTNPPIGDTLAGDHAAGVEVLELGDVITFDEIGGQLLLGDEELEYTGIDDDQGLVLLASPTVSAWVDGTDVVRFPEVREKKAQIEISSTSTVEVTLNAVWYPIVAAAIREPGQQAIVTLRQVGADDFLIEDVWGVQSLVDGANIDPDTIPPVAPVQPASSPEPTVVGLTGQLLVMTPGVANATPVEYEYHLALSNVAAPDSSTLSTQSTSTGVNLTSLPDGTPEGTALEYDTDYYVAVVAKSGDLAAAPSSWVVGRLNRVGTQDIAVGSITGALISSIVNSSSLFRTATTGQRTENDINGYRVYDSTGAVVVNLSPAEVIILADYMYAKFLETGGALLGGLTQGPAGGEFRMGTGILEAPGAALAYSSSLSMVDLTTSGADSAVTDGADVMRFYVDSTQKKIMCRRNSFAGANLGLSTTTDMGSSSLKIESINSIGVTPTAAYITVTLSDFTERIWRITRPTSSTWGTRSSLVPTNGPGGDLTPYVGVQRGSGDVLLAHNVIGAQTIGGVSYADGEVMVRRFTPSVSGSDLILTLNKTIKTGLIFYPTTVEMDADGETFDTPADSGKTSIIVSSLDQSIIVNVSAGASVTATAALGANEWEDVDPWRRNTLFDGSTFWDVAVDPEGAASLAERPANDVTAVDVAQGFTYYNGVNETELSPVLTADIKARCPSKWTIPTLPAGVDEVRLYLSADPVTRTRFERVGTFAGTPGSPLLIDTAPIEPPAGAASNPPPAASDYPGGNVYTVTTADPETHVDGDGTMSARDPALPTDVVNLRTLEALTDWTPFTPSWSGVTLGTTGLVNTASYVAVGKVITVKFNLVLGTGGAVTGPVLLALPVTAADGTLRFLGLAIMVDGGSSSSYRGAGVRQASAASVAFTGLDVAGANLSATVPWTWAAGDSIAGTFTYEAA